MPLKQAGGLKKESEKELRAEKKKNKIKETVFFPSQGRGVSGRNVKSVY